MDKATFIKIGGYLRLAGIVITLAAFPVDDGNFLWYGFIVMTLGGALRFFARLRE